LHGTLARKVDGDPVANISRETPAKCLEKILCKSVLQPAAATVCQMMKPLVLEARPGGGSYTVIRLTTDNLETFEVIRYHIIT
jgi:hypothetical protein